MHPKQVGGKEEMEELDGSSLEKKDINQERNANHQEKLELKPYKPQVP